MSLFYSNLFIPLVLELLIVSKEKERKKEQQQQIMSQQCEF